MKLIVYGDFNCPLSYAASARVDVIQEQEFAAVEWRAVEHDPSIPTGGRCVDTQFAEATNRQIAAIKSRLRPGDSLPLRLPPFQSNTAAATVVYANAPAETSNKVRRRLFRAVWVLGRNVSDPVEVAHITGIPPAGTTDRVAYWRRSWLGLERPEVPILLLHTGYVARGLVAVACLRRLAFTGSLPYRPWTEFRSDILNGSRLDDLGGPRNEATTRRRSCPQDSGTTGPLTPRRDSRFPTISSRRSRATPSQLETRTRTDLRRTSRSTSIPRSRGPEGKGC
jgi:DSBA-like thioredoxin domain